MTLGRSTEDNKEIGRYVDEMTSTIVLGQPGTGKSVFLLSQIYQHIKRHDGVFVLDPHDNLVAKTLEAVPADIDVIYINPKTLYAQGKGVKLNLLDVKSGKDQVVTLFVEAVRGLYKDFWTPETEQTIRNVFKVLLAQPKAKLGDIAKFLSDREAQERFLKNVDEALAAFWKYNYTPSAETSAILDNIANILKEDAVSKMFDCYESTIDFDRVMAEQKCVLVALPEGGIPSPQVVDFVGSLLLTKIYLAGIRRKDRTPFYVYVDEAHRFTTAVIRNALAELRKFGVFFTFATQTLGQYDDNGYASSKAAKSILDMCQTIVSFRTDTNTAAELMPYFQSRYTVNDIVNMRNYAFVVRVPVNGVMEYSNLMSIEIPTKNDATPVIERSLQKYGQPTGGVVALRPQIEQPSQVMDSPEIAVAGLLVKDDKVLVTQSAKWSHKWAIPGGHIKRNETMYEAFKREMYEEVGITVDSGDLLYVDDLIAPLDYYRKAHFVLIVFRSHVDQSAVILDKEAYKYKWVDPADLSGYDLTQWSLKAIQHIGAKGLARS